MEIGVCVCVCARTSTFYNILDSLQCGSNTHIRYRDGQCAPNICSMIQSQFGIIEEREWNSRIECSENGQSNRLTGLSSFEPNHFCTPLLWHFISRFYSKIFHFDHKRNLCLIRMEFGNISQFFLASNVIRFNDSLFCFDKFFLLYRY